MLGNIISLFKFCFRKNSAYNEINGLARAVQHSRKPILFLGLYSLWPWLNLWTIKYISIKINYSVFWGMNEGTSVTHDCSCILLRITLRKVIGYVVHKLLNFTTLDLCKLEWTFHTWASLTFLKHVALQLPYLTIQHASCWKSLSKIIKSIILAHIYQASTR